MKKIGTHNDRDVLETVLASETGVRISVINYGAVIRDWQVPVAGGMRSVVLGFDHFEDYPKHSPYFGAIAGRVANRIGNSRFHLNGKDYVLPANEGAHHLHGGPGGIGTQIWQMERIPGEEAVRLILTSPDGEMGYPGTLDMEVIYRLSGNRLRVEFYAETDAPTPVNIVQHNYFNLMGEGDVLDHEMWAQASAHVVLDPELIPTGEIRPVAGTPLDFRKPRTLRDEKGEAIAYDNNLVLDTRRDLSQPVAVVTAPDGSLTLKISTDQPGLQFYNAGKLALDVPGLHGVHYPRFAGFCLEDQNFPDAINHPHFPTPVLEPGQAYTHWCEIEIA